MRKAPARTGTKIKNNKENVVIPAEGLLSKEEDEAAVKKQIEQNEKDTEFIR